jgi:hypothetical protein
MKRRKSKGYVHGFAEVETPKGFVQHIPEGE